MVYCFKYLSYHLWHNTLCGLPFFTYSDIFRGTLLRYTDKFYQYASEILQILELLSILSYVPFVLDNIDLLCACIAPMVHASHIIAKTIHFRIYRRACLKHLTNLELILECNNELNIPGSLSSFELIRKKSRYVRITHTAHLFGQIISTAMFFIPCFYNLVTSNVLNLPMVGTIPWNTSSIFGFAIAAILQFAVFCFYNIKMIAVDYFVMHLIVLHYTETIFCGKMIDSIILQFKNNNLVIKEERSLKNWIALHQKLTKANLSLKELLSGYLIIQYLYVLIHTCFAAFVITSTQSWSFAQKSALVIMVSSGLFSLFLLAEAGNTLAAVGLMISKKLYGPWLLSWPQMQIVHQMYTCLNYRPFHLKFISLFPLCLPTFTAINRLILTYYMALNEVQSMKNACK